jgi:hypothetical protein
MCLVEAGIACPSPSVVGGVRVASVILVFFVMFCFLLLLCLSTSCVLCTKCYQFLFVCLRPVFCVPSVTSFSLFVYVLCSVYQVLPVSLCLSTSCVLCTKCYQFLWIVPAVFSNVYLIKWCYPYSKMYFLSWPLNLKSTIEED